MSSIDAWNQEAFIEFYDNMLEEARGALETYKEPEDLFAVAEIAVDKNSTLGWFCTLEGSMQALRFTRNRDAWSDYWDAEGESSTIAVLNRFVWYALRQDLLQDLEAEA